MNSQVRGNSKVAALRIFPASRFTYWWILLSAVYLKANASQKCDAVRMTKLSWMRSSWKLSAARSAFEVAKSVFDNTSGTSDETNLHDVAQTAFDDAKAELDNAQKAYDALTTDVDEVIQAGMPAMTIGKLDTLKVTVYIPEDQYRKISFGEKVTLNIDSFLNKNFTATVTNISDKAEFSPQNGQTTMYAVELSIANSNQKLKPGMPVDVTFRNQLASKFLFRGRL